MIALALAGCVSAGEDLGTWQPIDSITGELAPEQGPVPEPRAAVAILRVATWNVHFGENPADLAARIATSHDIAAADVLLIQEIEAYPDEPTSRTRRLAEALGMTWVYAPARPNEAGTHGIALLSRYPLEAVAVRELVYIEQPLRPRRRIALAADVIVGAARVRVVDLHLDVRIGPADRIRQLHGAVADLEPGTPVIAGGDFNTNPWAWVEATVPLVGTEAIVGQEQAVVVDDYMQGIAFRGAIPVEDATLRVPAFQMRTDDLYARDLPIAAAGVEHVEGSDHWPVWFDVAL